MRDLMKTNIYEAEETIIVIGSCLEHIQSKGYEKLKNISENIFELCLEQTHINMAITKIGGMLRTGKIKNIIFATVDKSPHCIQVHYIRNELEKMMNLKDINITNYVIIDNELVEIDSDVISMSKSLGKLKGLMEKSK